MSAISEIARTFFHCPCGQSYRTENALKVHKRKTRGGCIEKAKAAKIKLTPKAKRALTKKLSRIESRAKELGGLVISFHGEMFVVVMVGARVTVATANGQHYASGLWRSSFVQWENEISLRWRLLDRIDRQLRRFCRSRGNRTT